MTAKTKKTIMIVCAEKSGDLLGANLMESLKTEMPDTELEFVGVGGSAMKNAGLDAIFNMSDIAVMGIFEVIPKLKVIFQRIDMVIQEAKKRKIDMLVTIDGVEFNFRVAKKLKKEMNIPCVHYGSPQVWAWRAKRVFKMQKFLDHVLTLFPFEPKYYEKTSLKASYVGHPVLDRFEDYMPKIAKKSLNKTLKLAILPGSRSNELKYLLPELAQTVIQLRQKFKNIKFMVPIAEGFNKENFEHYFSNVEYVSGENKFKKLQSCDAAVACSGTVNLELAMLGLPMVVCYRMNNLTYQIAKRLIKIKYISPVNIVAEKRIVKELIQEGVTSENIVKSVMPLLKDTKQRKQMLQDLKTMREKMTVEEAFAGTKAAKIVASYL